MAREEHIRALGQVLIEQGLLSGEQLEEALKKQKQGDKSLGALLEEMGYLREEALLHTLGGYLGYEVINLEAIDIPAEVLRKIPPSTCQLNGVIPISFEDDVLKVALADPFNIAIIDELRFMLGVMVQGVLAKEEAVWGFIASHFGTEESLDDVIQEVTTEVAGMGTGDLGEGDESKKLSELATKAPVVELLNRVILQAVERRASDIHFEPFEKSYKIRYRIDGACYEVAAPPKGLSVAVASRIKVLANMDVAESRLPQDGRIMITVGKRDVDLRVSTLPTVFGESIVMRVLDKGVVSLSIDQIGLSENLKKSIISSITKPNGIFLLTGPTGSGKTTTLYSCLKHVNTIETKVITTEDPVEYDIPGIIQVPINPKIDLTFAAVLRSILRQDPDIIMVGEIRDTETARIAVQSALTGHLVFSTLHTNDAPSAVTRLMDMEIEPFLISSTVQAVLAQRLVRKICTDCREERVPSPEEIELLGLTKKDIAGRAFFTGAGCAACNGAGFKGRVGIFELFLITEKIREMIVRRERSSEIKRVAMESGMRTLREDGLSKAYEGVTTPGEVLKVTQSYL
ncbi:MAG: Flp pilus assembly complex ATPase component TadA [Candidatus Omnitrophica bacterium]|nr:Flp pilus assembly complex ATPase component TadA [Candidatus Omnitrophota bacterium]